jgi:transcriptional regulator with XRE-family HTH domain
VDLVVGPGERDNPRFGDLLARLRERVGLSRADAAAQLGFSVEYIRLIEAGRRTPALGQMQAFLDVYEAEGVVGQVQRDGTRPDLLVFDPMNDEEPLIVEFRSRIRAGRGNKRDDLGAGADRQEDADEDGWVDGGVPAARAAEIGFIVSMLTQANSDTLSRIRELLENERG